MNFYETYDFMFTYMNFDIIINMLTPDTRPKAFERQCKPILE